MDICKWRWRGQIFTWADGQMFTSTPVTVEYISASGTAQCSASLADLLHFPTAPSNRNRPHKSTVSHDSPTVNWLFTYLYVVIWPYTTSMVSCYIFWFHAHSTPLFVLHAELVLRKKLRQKFGRFHTVLSGKELHLELGRESAVSWPSTKDDDDENVVSDLSLMLPQTPRCSGQWLELERMRPSRKSNAGNLILIKFRYYCKCNYRL